MTRSLIIMLLVLAACATQRQTDSAIGAGIGAILGKAIGGSTSDAALGAALGGGIGWAMNRKDEVPTGPLADTKWLMVSLQGDDVPEYESFAVHFRGDGTVVTTRTLAGGKVVTVEEQYRVVGTTLVIRNPDGVVNATYLLEQTQLIVDAGTKFRAVLRRI